MAIGTPTNRNTVFSLTSPVDNAPVTLSIPVVTTGAFIQSVNVQYAAPECTLMGVSLNNAANGAATTLWQVRGKAGSTYKVTLAVAEVGAS